MLKTICWWCKAELPSLDLLAHDCPASKLSDDEKDFGAALMAADICDHFCCGRPANVCRVQNAYAAWARQKENRCVVIQTTTDNR